MTYAVNFSSKKKAAFPQGDKTLRTFIILYETFLCRQKYKNLYSR